MTFVIYFYLQCHNMIGIDKDSHYLLTMKNWLQRYIANVLLATKVSLQILIEWAIQMVYFSRSISLIAFYINFMLCGID